MKCLIKFPISNVSVFETYFLVDPGILGGKFNDLEVEEVYYTSSKFLLYVTIEFGGKQFDQSPVAIHDG